MASDRMTRRKFVRDATAAAAAIAVGTSAAEIATTQPKAKILNYNEKMEYRRLGGTGIMLSAISLGGHWKNIQKVATRACGEEKWGWLKANVKDSGFAKNRRDVVTACIDCGMNYIDACSGGEVLVYAEALRGRRDKMYLGYSYYEHEPRFDGWQTKEKLLESLDDMMGQAKLEYVDLWRITCYQEPPKIHTSAQEEAIASALAAAKKAGKARFTGISTHNHDWVIRMMETYPEQIQVIVVPYTAGSKKAHARVDMIDGDFVAVEEKRDSPKANLYSLVDAVKKNKVGWIGIKPFAGGSVFKSHGVPNSPTKKEYDELARMTFRYVLANEALTTTIPGLITVDQAENAAKSVFERRTFDLAEARRFQKAVDEMWTNLPEGYEWLRQEWEHV